MYSKGKATLLLAVFFGLITLGGCAKKRVVSTTPPPSPPPPAPTATISANPAIIQQGQATELSWKTQNATEVTISGIGTVSSSGTRSITPAGSTTYDLTAKGPGGTGNASTRVTVNPAVAAARPAASDQELFKQYVKDVFFDYDKFNLRSDGQQAVEATARFLQQYPNIKVVVEGHCDERGSEEYNLGLGDNRAGTVKEALAKLGINPARIRTVSYGKERPFCTGKDEQCFQQNRRGHFVLDR
jgi:peptidoglycan-associated lipoprotein